MNQFDEWAHIIAKQLKSDAELVGVHTRNELYQDSARDNFIKTVLEPFLPVSFAIGSGHVIDSAGQSSSAQDIIIYRRDFPQFNLPGNQNIFLYESVLATIQVKSKLLKKTLFDSLDQCASMAELDPSINEVVLKKLAAINKLTLNRENKYVHQNPVSTSRFHLIGRPPAFVYAFSGHQSSEKQLKENIDLWIEHRAENQQGVDLKTLPSVIATQGCFAWRNTAPFPLKGHILMGIGKDSAPVRFIILQLMHAINRGLRNHTDSFGLKPNIDAYLKQTEHPSFVCAISKAKNSASKAALSSESTDNKKIESVTKTKQSAPSSHTEPASHPQPVIKNLSPPGTNPVDQAVTPDKSSTSEKSLSSSFYGNEAPAEEYKFQPINETAEKIKSENQKVTDTHSKEELPAEGITLTKEEDDPFIKTQVITTSKNPQKVDENEFIKTQVLNESPDSDSTQEMNKIPEPSQADAAESLIESHSRLKEKSKPAIEPEISPFERTHPQLRD